MCWPPEEDLRISLFYYKRSFEGTFAPDSEEEAFVEIRRIFSSQRAFDLSFERFAIDCHGSVMLLGYTDSQDLSVLRDALHGLLKEEYRCHDAYRPDIIGCVIGRVCQPITVSMQNDLRAFLATRGRLPDPVVLRVDRARCVILRGHYLNHGLHPYQEEKPFTFLDSHLLDQEGRTLLKFEGYGVMTASKWLAHPGVVQKIVQRKFDEITPVTSQISPSLRCTNACPMCSYAQTKDSLLQAAHRADLEMSDRDMTLTINALCSGGVKGLVFTGGGEPLVNEHTIMGMGLAKNMKMSVGLFTNGVLLNDKAAARIVSIDPSFVRVSLNAGTSDAYAAVHGCDSHDTFQTVLANIRSLAEQKLATQARFHLDIGVLITPFCLDTPTCVGRPHECH